MARRSAAAKAKAKTEAEEVPIHSSAKKGYSCWLVDLPEE